MTNKILAMVRRPLVALGAGLLVALFFVDSTHGAERQTLRGHTPALVSRLQPVGRLAAATRLDLTIALPIRNGAALSDLLQQLYDPASPNYHRYLTPAQFAEEFGPTEEDYQGIIAFAEASGLTVTGRHPNRTLLDVNGPATTIEKAFHVNLRVYRHPREARTFFAPDVEPSVNLSIPLLAAGGLDDLDLPRPMGLNLGGFTDQTLNGVTSAAGSGPRGSFIGRDFRAAYAPGVTLTGAGQSVGLFQLDGYYPSDIAAYRSLAGLPSVPLTNVFLNGFNGTPGVNNVEVALDIEMAIAMAPGLTKVIVYQGRVPNDILNRMATDNEAKQLSCSWGFGAQVDPARQQIFLQFAAQGQSFFQASGDLGAWTGPIYPPSDDPFVTVVGGTALMTGPGGAWLSETTWSPSGGGISTTYPIPIWQQGINISLCKGSATMRNIPDVACLADDVIWLIANNGEQGIIGGTSAAAPLWAGFTALVNQQAEARGQPGVGFLNPAIYAMAQTSVYGSVFHDIITGNNTNSGSSNNFFAVGGYDLCTGWGTPVGSNLIEALLAPAGALRITPETALTFTRPPGAPFEPPSRSILLSNDGAGPLQWALAISAPWLKASLTNGILTAGGPVVAVAVSPTAMASELAAGSYTATVWFTNLSDGRIQSRPIRLTVVTFPMTTPETTMDTLYAFNGGTVGGNPNGLLQSSTGTFYGTTRNGGSGAAGTVFQMTTNGLVSTVYSFSSQEDGANPFAPLAEGPDGQFYGTTFQGGSYDNGTVFRIGENGTLATLLSFTAANGDFPFGQLTLGIDANFYGTSYQGGSYGRGTVFRIATNGTFATLHSFPLAANLTEGNFPAAALALAGDGRLWGTTYKGGAFNRGTVFRITANGSLLSLVHFNGTNGSFPLAGLAQATDGSFYGSTSQGGAYDKGTVFRMSPAGQFTSIYSFTGGSDGGRPTGGLLLSSDGHFYGTTEQGGSSGLGTVFRLPPQGTLTTLAHFNGHNGANPQAALIEARDGNLYGTTPYGGIDGQGVLFRLAVISAPQITSQPADQTVFHGASTLFSVAVFGSGPLSYQWRKNGTNLADGGRVSGALSRILRLNEVAVANVGSYSVVVSNVLGSVTSAGALLQVTSFPPVIVTQPASQTLAPGVNATLTVGALGNLPLSYQWQHNGTNLTDGGNLSGAGSSILSFTKITEANNGAYVVIVSNSLASVASMDAVLTVIPPSAPGTRLTTLHFFSGETDGGVPNGLTLATNGHLYGTTQFGGAARSGVAFSLAPDGAFRTLASFGSSNGVIPRAGLMQAADGDFYGTTQFGGAFDAGTVFRMKSDGTLASTYSFTGTTDGLYPMASLIQAGGGEFYGTTRDGGDYQYGTVFRIGAGGTLTNLHSFTNGHDGVSPDAALLQGSDGNYYGMTAGGGVQGFGNIFKMSPNGVMTTLYTFTNGAAGSAPAGALVQATDGNLYGVTKRNTISGFPFYGTIFKISTNGVLATLYPFNFSDGSYPAAGLVEASDGNLYGTTESGGSNGKGTLFRISPAGSFSTLVSFDGFNIGAHPAAALVEGTDGRLYGTTASGGPDGHGTIFRLAITSSPQITGQPANQVALPGEKATFSVAVVGAPPLFYHWRKGGTDLADGIAISGAASRILTLTDVSFADGGSYSVMVSNSLGSVTSSSALLTAVLPPAFQAVTLTNGTVRLTWSAFAGLRYRVQFNSNPAATNWANLGGVITATNATATVSDPNGSSSQRFYRVFLLR